MDLDNVYTNCNSLLFLGTKQTVPTVIMRCPYIKRSGGSRPFRWRRGGGEGGGHPDRQFGLKIRGNGSTGPSPGSATEAGVRKAGFDSN